MAKARLTVVLACLLLWTSRAGAQETERFAFDSVVSVDVFGGENVSSQPQVIVDMSGAMRVSEHVQAYFRPWFRLPRPNSPNGPVPDWSRELWQAGIRWERPAREGSLATRVDVGYNISPIGLGVMDNRPSLNPTIGTHMSYVIPMPAFDPTVPRVSAIAGTYPLGAHFTVSSTRWDARGSVINAAPTRNYAVGRATSPRQTPVFVAGAGLSPLAGLRVGVSIAQGDYATADEVTGPVRTARGLVMIGGEVEYAFGYTKVSGEFVSSRFERTEGTATAHEYFVQGLHTLTPRWFVAGRHEATSAPPIITPTAVGARARLAIVEGTAGFRVTPAVTVRGSYYTRKSYGAQAWDHQAAASVVWAQRWW
jgi:hypothetical protein